MNAEYVSRLEAENADLRAEVEALKILVDAYENPPVQCEAQFDGPLFEPINGLAAPPEQQADECHLDSGDEDLRPAEHGPDRINGPGEAT